MTIAITGLSAMVDISEVLAADIIHFDGGATGSLLTWDAGATAKVSFQRALGLNAPTPTVIGTMQGIIGSVDGVGLFWRSAAGVTGGAFAVFQTTAFVTKFSVGFAGDVYVNRNSVALPPTPAIITSLIAQFGGADGAVTGTVIDAFGNVPVYGFRRANGTNAARTSVSSGDLLAMMYAEGYNSGGGYSGLANAAITFVAAENYTTTYGNKIQFQTTPIGASVIATPMTVGPTGAQIHTPGSTALPGDPPAGCFAVGRTLIVNRNTTAISTATALPYDSSSAATLYWGIPENNKDSFFVLGAFGILGSGRAPGAHLVLRNAHGTFAAPTAIGTTVSIYGAFAHTGDCLGTITWSGYGATGFSGIGRVGMDAKPTEQWTDAAQGSMLSFFVTPTGGIATREVVHIDQDGSLRVTRNETAMASAGALGNTYRVRVANVDNAGALVGIDAHGASSFAGYVVRRSRGTMASPSALSSGDIIGFFSAVGYGATAYAGTNSPGIEILTTQAWTDANQGSEVRIRTTVNGSATDRVVATFGQNAVLGIIDGGGAQIGGSAARATPGTNRIDIFNAGTPPAGALTNGVSLYASGGKLYAIDAAGYTYNLTP